MERYWSKHGDGKYMNKHINLKSIPYFRLTIKENEGGEVGLNKFLAPKRGDLA